jgi:hypothetical protein
MKIAYVESENAKGLYVGPNGEAKSKRHQNASKPLKSERVAVCVKRVIYAASGPRASSCAWRKLKLACIDTVAGIVHVTRNVSELVKANTKI